MSPSTRLPALAPVRTSCGLVPRKSGVTLTAPLAGSTLRLSDT